MVRNFFVDIIIILVSITGMPKGAFTIQRHEKVIGEWLFSHDLQEFEDTQSLAAFTLFEDIFIMYELLRRTPKTFKETYTHLAGYILPRTEDSIRRRYTNYLKNITSEMMKQIVDYINAGGRGNKYLIIIGKRAWIRGTPLKRGPKGGRKSAESAIEFMDIEEVRMENHYRQVRMGEQHVQGEIRMHSHGQQARMGEKRHVQGEVVCPADRRAQQYSILVNHNHLFISTLQFDRLVEGCSGNLGVLIGVLGDNHSLTRQDLHWTPEEDELLIHSFGKPDYKAFLEPLKSRKKVGYVLADRARYLKSTNRWVDWTMAEIAQLMRSYGKMERIEEYNQLLMSKGQAIIQQKVRWLKGIGRWNSWDQVWCDAVLMEYGGGENTTFYSMVVREMGRDLVRQRVLYLKSIGKM